MSEQNNHIWNQRLSVAGLPISWPERDSRFAPLAAILKNDLVELEESKQTLLGFSQQLAGCFDTIDTLYAIGREMHDISQPSKFFEIVVGRLHSVLSFGWLGLVFLDTESCPDTFRGRSRFGSGAEIDAARIAELLRGVVGTRQVQASEIIERMPGVTGQLSLHAIRVKDRVIGVFGAGAKHGDDPRISSYDTQLLEAAAGMVGSFCENVVLYEEQRQMFLGTVRALTAAIDAKDRYTCGHSERVAYLAGELAERAGLSDAEIELVRLAGLVHDVGKIGVPEAVLTKAGKLTDAEFGAIKQHPEIGHRILSGIPPLEPVLPAVLHHHERYDGRGYPHGLIAEQIPLFARIVSIADTFDAMSSSRSYRPALDRDRVLREMAASGGTQLDPALVQMFVMMDHSGYDTLMRAAAASGNVAA